MAKAYTFEQEKRAWARNVAQGLKRYAEAARCPKCERKNAFHKKDYEFNLQRGLLIKACRYCGYVRTVDLRAEKSNDCVESWVGPKTCPTCERRDRHSHDAVRKEET